jgi:hypothetical protein
MNAHGWKLMQWMVNQTTRDEARRIAAKAIQVEQGEGAADWSKSMPAFEVVITVLTTREALRSAASTKQADWFVIIILPGNARGRGYDSAGTWILDAYLWNDGASWYWARSGSFAAIEFAVCNGSPSMWELPI